MIKIRILALLLVWLSLPIPLQAQGLATPSEGNVLVYFIRTTGTGALINFKYFDGEKYLGKFSGKNYFVYECEPGKHVFWVTSENRQFMEADLLPNRVYMVEVIPTPGAIKAAVKILPIARDNQKSLKRVNKLISSKAPINLDKKDFSGEQEHLAYYIQNGMKKYKSDKEKGKSLAQLPSNFHH